MASNARGKKCQGIRSKSKLFSRTNVIITIDIQCCAVTKMHPFGNLPFFCAIYASLTPEHRRVGDESFHIVWGEMIRNFAFMIYEKDLR